MKFQTNRRIRQKGLRVSKLPKEYIHTNNIYEQMKLSKIAH